MELLELIDAIKGREAETVLQYYTDIRLDHSSVALY